MTDGSDKDRESYLRWQELAITQLGYTINLFLTLTTATLAFSLKILMESQAPFSGSAHCFFHVAVPFLGISIVSALGANWTRALDFRYTRLAAWERVTNGTKHDDYQRTATSYGNWTWGLFYCQTLTFGLGVVLLALSIWLAYGGRV
jgi:hypothetical protein